jgi:O-antigen ligase
VEAREAVGGRSAGASRFVGLFAAVAGFGLVGLAMSAASTTVLALALVLAVWAAVVALRLGTGGIVTVAMMAVAATAPLNGVRVGSIALTDVFLVCATGALLLRSLDRSGGQMTLPPGAWLSGFALIVMGGTLGTFFADNPGASLAHLFRLTISSIGPVLVVLSWRPDDSQVRRYTWLWVLGAGVSGVLALVEGGDASGRSAGLTTHPNHLAFISSLGAGLALTLALTERAVRRGLAITALTILSLAVLRAGSRAGLVALTVTVAVVVIQNRRAHGGQSPRGRYVVVLLGLAVVGSLLLSTGRITLGPHNAITRSLGDVTTATSDEGRSVLLSGGVQSIADNPLTGAGLEHALQAHNVYVQMAASAGILGLLGFVLVAGTTLRAGLARAPVRRADDLAVGFVAGYAGYLVGAFFQNLLWDRYLWLHVAMVIWCWERSRRATAPAEQCA